MAETPGSQNILPEPDIVLIPQEQQQQGLVGPFLLADLENALAAYRQNQGQVTDPDELVYIDSPLSAAKGGGGVPK